MALCLVGALGGLGCGRGSARSAGGPAGSASVAASARPAVDTTEEGELAEGTERAFGLVLPREMRVAARFPDEVFAGGEVRFEAASNFVRQRVAAEHVETGPVRTVFVRAHPKAEPKRELHVIVTRKAGGVELVVRDQTPRPAERGLTEEERWKQLGLTPHGEQIDPNSVY
ncbi:MAG: hypothetical protein HY744_26270 [Deltaproteobacteria bacterium]|nr:hypothetical protein [Deltaproteobacteria bacterium]